MQIIVAVELEIEFADDTRVLTIVELEIEALLLQLAEVVRGVSDEAPWSPSCTAASRFEKPPTVSGAR